MADTLKADVAKELDITARRNDSFQLQLVVKDSSGQVNLTGSTDSKPTYQGKMTIINQSGDEVISIYSYTWRGIDPIEWDGVDPKPANFDTHPQNTLPTPSTSGHWSGTSFDDTSMGIYLEGQSATAGEFVTVTIPHEYMNFQSGEYKYDFQIRKMKSGGGATNDSDAEFTTWLYGKFILNADITQL